MGAGKICAILDIFAGLFVILSGLFWLIYTIQLGFYVNMLIIAIFLFAIGITIVLVACRPVPWVQEYCRFYYTVVGRGIFLIIIGAFNWSGYVVGWIGPLYCWLLGVTYLIVACVPGCPRPEPLFGPPVTVAGPAVPVA